MNEELREKITHFANEIVPKDNLTQLSGILINALQLTEERHGIAVGSEKDKVPAARRARVRLDKE